MSDSKKIFSLEGKGLKLTTAADVEPHIADLRANDVEEVRLLGNSLGIEACKVLGEVLATKKNLKVANLADIFTARVLSEIPDALSHLLTSILNLPNLHTININDNAFGLNTQAPLVAFLAAHVPLQHLYLNNTLKAVPSLLRWLITGGGPLASNWRPGPRSYSSGGAGPDVEVLGAPIAFIHHGEEQAPPGIGIFSLGPTGLRPQSSGTITLRTADPFDHPIIDPKYFSDAGDNDRKVLLAGLRMCIKISRSTHWAKFLKPMPTNDDPSHFWWPASCSDPDTISDEQLFTFMKEKAFTLYHPVGTARMGPKDAGNTVVDLNGCVHGVGRLRVVDASMFPEQISGHPTAAIGAIAYKMSDIIKATYTPPEPKLASL
ncbi:hypothetical protein NQ176_g4305 [Zarea fungicola]|uniref:Uncharacterized protein n=1 Tax=Zarea fungicola TaxID=93591 RepID=A0ACC1NG28_9HYPO|nr:hypothetical protein NQ176_g4305 [Lecanicillium fungicola]